MIDDIDARIRFDADRQMLDLDFSGLTFDSAATVHRVFDRIATRIAHSGEGLWHLLVDLRGTRIGQRACVAHSSRARALMARHSLSCLRVTVAADPARRDPGVCHDRAEALARIDARRSGGATAPAPHPTRRTDDIDGRIAFDHQRGIMEVDFSNFVFRTSADVDRVYDHIEEQIGASGRDRWFFMINYESCRILRAAWQRHGVRGLKVNRAHSLGTVRFGPGSDSEAEIRYRARSLNFRPNIRTTRDEALARIDELRLERA